jgi:asparagine synthase (glutamine-hydrolysing)
MALLDGELAGVHDRRDRADGDLLRRALPGAEVVEAGALALACATPGRAGGIWAALAGRLQHPGALRAELGLGEDETIEHALAAGYARWGDVLAERLRGPFALVAWDRDHQRGLLAQDQLGGRSLFTFRDGARLLFATEVSVLLDLLARRPEPDELALTHHLVDHSVPDGRTLYSGIRRIGGGHRLELSDAGQVRRRYWMPRYTPPLGLPRADLAARLRAELTAAIDDAVPADRSSALLLSGGLDSSAVAAIATRRAPRLDAFAAAFPTEPEFDETAWAQRVAEHLGIALSEVAIQQRDPLQAGERWLRVWRLPLPVPGLIIERPLIAAAADQGATVVLDGQGGDELFSTAHFLIADRVRRLRLLAAWRLARRHEWLGADPPLRHVWRVFSEVGLRGAFPPELHERARRRQSPDRYAPDWLRPDLLRLYRDDQDPWRWKRLDGPRWWASHADTLTRGRERADIADYVRRRARLGNLEARSPLLDVGLVELVLTLPPETNFNPVTSRSLVREALHGTLPDAVLARQDKNDYAPLQHRTLLRADNLGYVRGLLDERRALVGAYVDLQKFRRAVLERPPAVGDAGWRGWAVHVWNVVTLEQWLRH